MRFASCAWLLAALILMTGCTMPSGAAGTCATNADCPVSDGGNQGACCNGACVDTSTDAKNCGGCGTACSATPNRTAICKAGTCTLGDCIAGFSDCDGVASNGCEIATQSDAKNCGACGHMCGSAANGTEGCVSGACAVTSCSTGFADCNAKASDGCEVTTTTDVMNCAGCGKACAPAANATVACQNAACVMSGCKFGFADCNKNPADGCEVDLHGTMNCGTCGTVCMAPPNATAGCSGTGMCGIGMCNTLFGDCDANAANGCELPLGTDVNNCGACKNACKPANAAPACVGGQCGYAGMCNAGFGDCDGSMANGCEVNVQTDPMNCGACMMVCAMTQVCAAGFCKVKDGQPCTGPTQCAGVCTGGVCARPSNCLDIKASNPNAVDGSFTVYYSRDANKPWTVYCFDMAGSPKEYLTLSMAGANVNFAQYTAGGFSVGTDVRTNYHRLRIDPSTLIVNVDDQTYATSVGMLTESATVVTSMPFASAANCIQPVVASGVGNVDLRGTPFVIMPNVFSTGGAGPVGAATYSAANQVVDLTAGGACGWIAPMMSQPPANMTGGAPLPLQYP